MGKHKIIVACLDQLSEKIKELKKLHLQTATGLDALTRSVLFQAFEGEL